MEGYYQNKYKEVLKKQTLLDNAKKSLKAEFVGIDHVIDEVVDELSSWYLFPLLQDKPLVINLWGLTGVGKTSLVNRLAKYLSFEEKYYHFNLGENNYREWAITNQLDKIYENINGCPMMIALDEFQHARTINEAGLELDKSASMIIWQLLDSGKLQISKRIYYLDDMYDLIQKLRFFLRNGVQVKYGKVIEKKEYFVKELNLKDETEIKSQTSSGTESNDVLFVPSSFYEVIFSVAKEKFLSPYDIKTILLKLDGRETIKFLLDIFSFGYSPSTVDCSKAVVFVLGNLDEAYSMSQNFSPDMDADEFHEQSLSINVPAIKKALKKRFRSEQIARLGNIHIIYPAFSRDSFSKIIEQELRAISRKVASQQKVKIQFDKSIHDLVYREGVYPTQGARPILSTIHQIISTKLGRIIKEMIIQNLVANLIVFKASDNGIKIEYLQDNRVIHTIYIEQKLELEGLRKNRKDDIQAISAVHESGHAIISSLLMGTVPEVIFSNTAESGNGGFIYTKFKWKYVSRKEIKHRLALFLSGFAAEKIIFGEENVTTGAEEDIEKATDFITEMLKKCGMGSFQGAYHNKDVSTRNFLFDPDNKLNKEAETVLCSAMTLAEDTLKNQELLLLKMADYLSDSRVMKKEKI